MDFRSSPLSRRQISPRGQNTQAIGWNSPLLRSLVAVARMA
jgi:hypothetical protein